MTFTIAPMAGSATVYGASVSDFQQELAFSGSAVTGYLASTTLTAFNDGGTDATGYFLAFTVEPSATSVALDDGTGEHTWLIDEDGEFVLKLTVEDDAVTDNLYVKPEGEDATITSYDLSALELNFPDFG